MVRLLEDIKDALGGDAGTQKSGSVPRGGKRK
jgi:hypothetical protein